MSFSRFSQLRRLIAKVKYEDEKDRFVSGAWISFLMGGGQDKNFKEYLEHLGLSENQVVAAPEAKKTTAASAIKKAEEILRLAQKPKN